VVSARVLDGQHATRLFPFTVIGKQSVDLDFAVGGDEV
jgi:hypothetical protein